MRFTVSVNKLEFNAGECVTGTVRCYKSRDFAAYGCFLEVVGIEQVREINSNGAVTKVVSNVFWTERRRLTAMPKQNCCAYMRGGDHAWPFSVQIPTNVPPSIVHPTGQARIVYEVRARISVAGDRDGSAYQQFNVHARAVTQQRAVTAHNAKTFLGNSTAPLFVRASSNREVFGWDEQIMLELDVANDSSKTVSHLRIRLLQHWTLNGKRSTVLIRELKLAPPQHFPLAPRRTFEGTVPIGLQRGLQPSLNCKWIACSYEVAVTCMVKGLAMSLSTSLPFIMAPLTVAAKQTRPAPQPQPVAVVHHHHHHHSAPATAANTSAVSSNTSARVGSGANRGSGSGSGDGSAVRAPRIHVHPPAQTQHYPPPYSPESSSSATVPFAGFDEEKGPPPEWFTAPQEHNGASLDEWVLVGSPESGDAASAKRRSSEPTPVATSSAVVGDWDLSEAHLPQGARFFELTPNASPNASPRIAQSRAPAAQRKQNQHVVG